jgi:hypothetical protein
VGHTFGGKSISIAKVEVLVTDRAYCKNTIGYYGFVRFEAMGTT